MKNFILLLLFTAFAAQTFAREVRYLNYQTSCSGTWVLINYPEGGGEPYMTGYGTFDFCPQGRLSAPESGEEGYDYEIEIPASSYTTGEFDSKMLTEEDAELAKANEFNITLYPNPSPQGKITGEFNEYTGDVAVNYDIIGYDGKVYAQASLNVVNGNFELDIHTLPAGKYFVLLGSSELDKVYHGDFIVVGK